MKKIISFLSKIHLLDKRIIYIVFLFAVLVPLIFPIGIPIIVSDYSKDFYAEIEKLDEGDNVVIDLCYSAVGYSDAHFQVQALVEHLARRKVNIYFLCGEPVSINYVEMFKPMLEGTYGYKYGENFVISPYLVGAEQGRKTFANNPKEIFESDAYGNKMSSLPFMQKISTIDDFKLAIATGTSIAHEWWIKQVPDTKLLAAIGTVQMANIMPYVESGQVTAVLPGVRSAAEYESLLGIPGKQLAKMDAQSLGISVILGFILLGNIGYFAEKKMNSKSNK